MTCEDFGDKAKYIKKEKILSEIQRMKADEEETCGTYGCPESEYDMAFGTRLKKNFNLIFKRILLHLQKQGCFTLSVTMRESGGMK